MAMSRREALSILSSAPLGATAACCGRSYPQPVGQVLPFGTALPGNLAPAPAQGAALDATGPVIDVHAHFFNASDVPVRGFLEECLGHRAPESAQVLLRALARIADRLARLAPTAAEEIKELPSLVRTGPSAAIAPNAAAARLPAERQATAERLADAIRGSEFEREYRAMHRLSGPSAGVTRGRSGPLSVNEILDVLSRAENPATPGAQATVSLDVRSPEAIEADGTLAFLTYMLSRRWVNLQSYMTVFTTAEHAFGIDKVLGALVDFDYWLDCPPLSSQDDQVRLHQRLYELYSCDVNGQPNPYFHPVVAYNPWTDIKQGGAGLKRVVTACTKGNFVAVKIYPPTGFRPFGNATIPADTRKARPNLKDLDTTLRHFFETCADKRIPVLAHTAFSNGRDNDHDDFGGPKGWKALLAEYASASKAQVVDFGHFGGAQHESWTQEFAELMRDQPRMLLYGDLGYWEELMCMGSSEEAACTSARERLRRAMDTAIPGAETVLDRVMFATDWLMLSRVDKWAQYPRRVYDTLRGIPGMDDARLAKVFGGNATKCFNL